MSSDSATTTPFQRAVLMPGPVPGPQSVIPRGRPGSPERLPVAAFPQRRLEYLAARVAGQRLAADRQVLRHLEVGQPLLAEGHQLTAVELPARQRDDDGADLLAHH